MKAFFHRLHLGSGAKDKEKDKDKERDKDKDRDKEKEKDKDSPAVPKEKFPPLRSWPPEDQHRPTTTSSSSPYTQFKPLPDLVPTQLVSQLPTQLFSRSLDNPLPLDSQRSVPGSTQSQPSTTPSQTEEGVEQPPLPTSPRSEHEPSGHGSRKNANGNASVVAANDIQKKVAFISPPPTPVVLDRALPDSVGYNPSNPAATPLKTTVSRFQAAHGKEPRGSLSNAASSSKTDVGSMSKTSVKATSTRTSSPYLQKADATSAQSLRSGTPYSQMSQNTSGSRILAATSWSEVTEEDLVSNIGSRERTRQEVLFEIISSEERYVQELTKMKDTFIDPLLHPFSMQSNISPMASTPNLDYDYYRSDSPFESTDDLPPIAARFMSPTPTMTPPSSGHPIGRNKDSHIDGESLETDEDDEAMDQAGRMYDARRPGNSKDSHLYSPYRGTNTRSPNKGGTSVPFPSRSHQSLPPAHRGNLTSTSTHSLGRQSANVDRERERKFSTGQSEAPSHKTGMLRKFKKSIVSSENILGDAIAPHQLPEDLRICLEVIDSGVFDGHKRLSEALKKRYDDQFPLVRSLADVFVANSDIFHGYATYVLHLERALEQVDSALSNVSTKKPKKQDAGEWQKVCKFLQQLEENACEKGETGLAITLSKPFQRLLKYPLLFQNLLFHTDPSTFEYESTLQMVAEVETIVRSIEDEKIQKEERDKTRDVFARIEGLDKVRQLALPKPSRVLLEERMCTSGGSPLNTSTSPKPTSPPPVLSNKGVRGKSSFKRLSDVLHSGGVGGKKDLWFVVFNDVVLQCQRTGTTSLPLVAATNSRTNSMPELQGKAKYATTGRRNSYTKPRNLYKFIKIETWAIGDVVKPREGVVSMEDVVRSRAQVQSQPRIVPLPDDDEAGDGDSDDSDKKSKMSFSYWGADKVTVQKPVLKGRMGPYPRRGGSAASYGRESSANAKFGTRLVSDGSTSPRPSSRRTHNLTPTSRRPHPPSEDNTNYAKATVTRPAWDTSTRSPIPPQTKRLRNTSQASTGTRTTTPAKAPVASPVPSEDSGVGLYRQLLANNPSLNSNS